MKHKHLYICILLAISITAGFYSCESDGPGAPPGDPVPIELTATQELLVEADNSFSFDLFRLTTGNEPGANLMVSPLSISYALSMTLNGAAGATRDSMMKALRYNDLDIDQVNGSFRDLTRKLEKVDERVIMTVANSVWVEDRLLVKQQFMDALVNYFAAESRSFNVNDPLITDVINQWIEDHTNGKIKDMIDELNPDVAMLLINAIYFNGKWRYRFDERLTMDLPFHTPSGGTKNVPTMYREEAYPVIIHNDFIMAELPYGQGNWVMDLILPSGDKSTGEIASILNPSDWQEWTSQMEVMKLKLYLPRFRHEYKVELNDILSAMGMGIAFSDLADLSGISDQPLKISRVLHQTFIDTREEGTEAAAATVVEIILTSADPIPMELRFDRPFIYVIRETTTGTIVFMGITADPSA